jgi:hypothetical protein
VVLPTDVVARIDKLVGRRGRSSFLVEAAKFELQRLEQLKALRAAKGAWKDKDHPELKDGAEAWVRTMRAEANDRYRKIERHRKGR